MRHGMAGRKLGRTSEHRQALFANLATELLRHGYIRTTLAKAKDLRRVVEPMITRAKKGGLHNRRVVESRLMSSDVTKKLFEDIAPTFKDTPGGYTRVVKAGFRQGDAAPMAIIALTEGKAPAAAKVKPAKTEKAAATPAEAKADEEIQADVAAAVAAEEVTTEAAEGNVAVQAEVESTTDTAPKVDAAEDTPAEDTSAEDKTKS